jgi:hypothetical protein
MIRLARRVIRRAKAEAVAACDGIAESWQDVSRRAPLIWRSSCHLAGDVYSGSDLRIFLLRARQWLRRSDGGGSRA